MAGSVLFVDGNRGWRARMVPALRALSTVTELREASGGREADALLHEHPADLLLVGGALNDGDGIDWVRALRTRGETARVILLREPPRAGRAVEPTPSRELRIALVLEKPLAPSELAEQLDPLLSPPPSASQPPRVLSPPPAASPVPIAAPPQPSGAVPVATRRPPAQAPSVSQEVDKGLASLRNDFVARLPSKLSAIGAALGAASEAPEDAGRLSEVRVLAHRLRGTAGAYGFPSVGEAAGRIEDALAPLPSGHAQRHFARAQQALEAAESIVALLRGNHGASPV